MSDPFVAHGTDSDQVWYTIDDTVACAVVAVGGRIDSHTCPGVCEAVRVAGGLSSSVVVDLSQAEFADAAAIGSLVGALPRSPRRAGSACVVGAPDPMRWLIRFGGLDHDDVTTAPSVAEAVTTVTSVTRVSRSGHGCSPP